MGASIAIPVWLLAIAVIVPSGLLGTGIAVLKRQRHQLRVLDQEAGRLRALAKERAERVSVLSHEVKTPLALVKGAGELLAEQTPGSLNSRQRQFVGTITENTQRVIDMAEDLLVEARIEATLFDVRLTRTDLRGLIRQIVRELRRVQETEIRLDSRGAPLMLPLDRRLMRQAIWNLVNNAVRHADGTHVTIRVTGGDVSVLVAVSDSGVGMTSSELKHLFTPFATGGTRRPGTGLGMTITQRIVEVHGGRLFVDTVAARGTTVFLSLPIPGES